MALKLYLSNSNCQIKKPIIIGTVYRPPSANVEYFDKIINVIEHVVTDHECVIVGGLNYNYVLDESLGNNPLTYLSQIAGLSQLVDKPTRETTSSSSLIDITIYTRV